MAGRKGQSGFRGIDSLLAALAVLGVLMGVATQPSAATPPDEVAGVTGSVVETVTTTAAGAVPDTPSPEPPSVPVAPPSLPSEVPVSPPALPAKPAPPASDPAANLPHSVSKVVGGASPHAPVGTIANGAKEAPGTVREATTETGRQAPGESNASSTASGGQAAHDELRARSGSGGSTIQATKFAPISWFLARVWPAIALERGGGLTARLRSLLPIARKTSLQSLASTAGLFPGSKGTRPVSAGIPPPEHPAAVANRAPTSPWDPVLSSGARIALFIAIAVLLTLLAFMLRTEFSAVPGRPGHR